MKKFLKENIAYFALVVALLATSGSLILGFRGIPICVFCWYQRILMYPLVTIISVGIIRKDRALAWYVLPLSILGMIVSAYHIALQNGWVSASLTPCTIGVSCVTKYAQWLGFITIPILAFSAFTLISALFIFQLLISKNQDE